MVCKELWTLIFLWALWVMIWFHSIFYYKLGSDWQSSKVWYNQANEFHIFKELMSFSVTQSMIWRLAIYSQSNERNDETSWVLRVGLHMRETPPKIQANNSKMWNRTGLRYQSRQYFTLKETNDCSFSMKWRDYQLCKYLSTTWGKVRYWWHWEVLLVKRLLC